MCVQTLPGSY